MNDHYYTGDPTSESRPVETSFLYKGHELHFTTDSGVFSRGELDKGSKTLLLALPGFTGKVLDLGCGWGAIGVAIGKGNPQAKITMADVNRRALSLAKENAARNGVMAHVTESDGFSAIEETGFEAIVSNPPIRAGKQVIYDMFRQAIPRLAPGGALYLVIRKQQGAPSAITFLKEIYTDVTVLEKSGGFWVIKAML